MSYFCKLPSPTTKASESTTKLWEINHSQFSQCFSGLLSDAILLPLSQRSPPSWYLSPNPPYIFTHRYVSLNSVC